MTRPLARAAAAAAANAEGAVEAEVGSETVPARRRRRREKPQIQALKVQASSSLWDEIWRGVGGGDSSSRAAAAALEGVGTMRRWPRAESMTQLVKSP